MPIDSATPKHEKVYRALRSQVLSGDLEPGYKIQSERVLAEKHRVNRVTITRVMKRLQSDGLITRGVGSGSYVADRLTTGHIAIVLSPGALGAEASPFYAKAVSALTSEFHEQNSRVSLRLHLGRDVNSNELYPQTLDLLDPDVRRDLRGVFTFNPLYEVGEELQKNDIPVVKLGVGLEGVPCSVQLDLLSVVDMTISRLIAASCKRIGMIWPHHPASGDYEDSLRYQRAVDVLTAGGVQVCKSWIQPSGSECSEKNGYDAMMRLWAQDEKIDGLAVLDDIDCRGVLRATSRLGLHLPNDLKLVSYANRGIELPYHKAVTRVEFDAGQLVKHAVQKMIDLTSRRSGDEGSSIMFKGELVEGETT